MNVISKYRNLSLPLKASFWFVVCNVVLKGISFISIPLFAKILSETEYGKLNVLISYQTLIIPLCTFDIYNGYYLKGMYDHKEDIKEYTSICQMFVIFLTSCLFAFLIVFRKWFYELTGFNDVLLACLYFYIIALTGFSFWNTRKRNDYNYKPVVTLTILASVVSVIVPLFCVLKISKTGAAKFSAGLLAEGIVYVGFLVYGISIKEIFNLEKIKTIWKKIISFHLPLLPHAISFYVLSQSDRIMIGKLDSDASVAFYSVAYNLAASIAIVQNGINQTILPWTYKKIENNRLDRIKRISIVVLSMLMCIIILFGLIAPDVLRILFEESYFEAVWCIPPIVTSIFFSEIYTLYVNILTYTEKTYYITYASIVCGAFNILLNYFGIEYFGYISCAYSTCICYIIMAILCYFFSKHACRKVGLDIDEIYDARKMIIISSLVVVAMVLMALLYKTFVMRYICSMVLVIISYYMFDKFKKLKLQS